MSAPTLAAWPNGKKIAVAVKIMFEAWSEGKWPPYIATASAPKEGVVNTAAQAWATYGGHVGAWRMLESLDKLNVPATFFTSARCTELYPDAVKQIVACGHDLAGHSYSQDQLLTYLKPDEQRAMIRRCIDMLQQCAGHKVTGWACPSVAFTPETAGLLAEAGLKWHADVTYTDLPFCMPTPYGTIAGVPTTDFSDLRVFKASTQDFFDVYKGLLKYHEQLDSMSMIVLVLHTQFAGRPVMTAVFEQTLRHLAQSPHVWFTRHKDMGEWALQTGRDSLSYADRFKLRSAAGRGR